MQREADGANTRWNPWERRITPANVASLQPVWSRHLVSRRPSQPLIAGGHVYVSRSSTSQPEAGMVALDLATGQTIWDRTISLPGASPAFPMDPGVVVGGELWTGWTGSSGDPCSGTVRIDRAGNVVARRTPGPPPPAPRLRSSGRHVVEVSLTACSPFARRC